MSLGLLGVEWFDFGPLKASTQWLRTSDIFVVLGIAVALGAAWRHFRLSRRESAGERDLDFVARWPIVFAGVALITLSISVGYRWVEVNHFPSQSMSEVLNMFTLALLVSLSVLHFALGLHRRSAGWAIVDDVLIALVLGSVIATHYHVSGLSTAQRDLPPALQSYWFAPHLSALIFSYATMSIAAILCLVYFCARFWTGAFTRGTGQGLSMLGTAVIAASLLYAGFRGLLPAWAAVLLPLGVGVLAVFFVPRAEGRRLSLRDSGAFVFLLLLAVPFVQIVTLPLLILTGLVFWGLARRDRLPEAAAIAGLERELDSVSFRAFSVGMPFLTAGLFMGAFWAQEAWANYWGWDSKENSALITWLVYVVYIHLRMLGGYRGEKAMAVLIGGALSVFLTFQVFGYLPDSQKSLHRYTDDGVEPREGQIGPAPRDPEVQAVVEPED